MPQLFLQQHLPEPGAGGADLITGQARFQHQCAHVEFVLVVLHPLACCANGNVIPFPIDLGEKRAQPMTAPALHFANRS